MHTLKYHAKTVVYTLYDWLFVSSRACDSSLYDTAACAYANADKTGEHASYGVPGYVAIARDKVAAVAASASNAVVNAAASLTLKHDNQHNDRTFTAPSQQHQHRGAFETLQYLVDPNFWRQLDPATAWDDLVGRYRPQLLEMQNGIQGWDHLKRFSERWNVEPRIVILVILLPVVLLFLSFCVIFAGHTPEDGPQSHRAGGHEMKSTSTHDASKQSLGSSPSERSKGSSATSSSDVAKGGKSRRGSKKGGNQDKVEALAPKGGSKAHKYQLGNNKSSSSWAALLGSTGFRGAEMLQYKPVDIYAAMDIIEPSRQRSDEHRLSKANGSAAVVKKLSKALESQTVKAETNKLEHAGGNLYDESLVSSMMEDILGPTESQQEQVQIELDNQQEYEEDIPQNDGNSTKTKDVNTDATATTASAKNRNKNKTKNDTQSTSNTKKVGLADSTLSPELSVMDSRARKSKKVLNENNPPHHLDQVPQQDRAGKQGAGPAGPGTEARFKPSSPLSRTRIPKAYGFKEADRHRHQPHISSHSKRSRFNRQLLRTEHDGGDNQLEQQRLAFKIMRFAQQSTVMKNLDGISGGVLGAVIATAAAVVNISESTIRFLKGSAYTSALDDLAKVLKESIDQDMDERGLERSVIDGGINQDHNWDLQGVGPQRQSNQRVTSKERRYSVEDISVGPRTKYAVYAESLQQSSKNKNTEHNNPFSRDKKDSDEDVRDLGLDYHSYKKPASSARFNRKGKKALAGNSAAAYVDWGASTTKASPFDYNKTSQSSSSPSSASGVYAKATVHKTDTLPVIQEMESVPKTTEGRMVSAFNVDQENVHQTQDQTERATKGTKIMATSTEDSARKAKVPSVGIDVKKTVLQAEENALKAVSDAKRAVESARASAAKAVDTATQIIEGSAAVVEDEIQDAVRDTKRVAGYAHKSAQKARHTLLRGIRGVEKRKQQGVANITFSSKDVAQGAMHIGKEAIDSASDHIQDASDATVGRASNVAYDAVNQAKASVDSLMGATKKILLENIVQPVRRMEHAIGSVVEIGKGTVVAAVQGAREAAEKLDQSAAPTRGYIVHKAEDDYKRVAGAASKQTGTVSTQKSAQDHRAAPVVSGPTSRRSKKKAAKKRKSSSIQLAKDDTSRSKISETKDKKTVRGATLDHNDYVFKDESGNQVPVVDVDEIEAEASASDENDGSGHDEHGRHSGLLGLLSQAPGIIHSATAAATAMAAHVADVSHENLDIAKHSLTDMVDNLTENLAGHEEPEWQSDDEGSSDSATKDSSNKIGKRLDTNRQRGTTDQESKSQWEKAVPATSQRSHITAVAESDEKNRSQKVHGADQDMGDAHKQLAGDKSRIKELQSTLAMQRKKTSSPDLVLSTFPSASLKPVVLEAHAYKPNRKSAHVDKDGFTIVEDPHLVHDGDEGAPAATYQFKSHAEPGKRRLSDQARLHPHQHVDTPAISRTTSATNSGVTTPRPRRSTMSIHLASHTMSYSTAAKMNVKEGDRVFLEGRTENHTNVQSESAAYRHIQPQLVSSKDSLFQNQDFIQDYEQQQPSTSNHVSNVVGELSASLLAYADKDPSHAHHHALQPPIGAEHYKRHILQQTIHPNQPFAKQQLARGQREVQNSAPFSVEEGKHYPQQEYIIDRQGNKVRDDHGARRDSGFDLLL
ncbi:hypothetical protein BGX28_004793 [Mortierella sp. GBA30]|nr:hypothetical protein BGX28_004793 [Mortierella sp. GBA30]